MFPSRANTGEPTPRVWIITHIYFLVLSDDDSWSVLFVAVKASHRQVILVSVHILFYPHIYSKRVRLRTQVKHNSFNWLFMFFSDSYRTPYFSDDGL